MTSLRSRLIDSVMQDVTALKSIALAQPDEIFPDHLQAAIPRLSRLGWIRVIGHSDGDYIKFTEKGMAIVGRKP